MKNLTLLLLTFAVFSCGAPSMEDDVKSVCEMTKALETNNAEMAVLSDKAVAGDADATAAIEVLTTTMDENATEMEAISERNKENEEEFKKMYDETCK